MKQKEEKKEYGRAIACRLSTDDYDYFIKVAEARRMKRSELLKQMIIECLNDLKEIEREYAQN